MTWCSVQIGSSSDIKKLSGSSWFLVIIRNFWFRIQLLDSASWVYRKSIGGGLLWKSNPIYRVEGSSIGWSQTEQAAPIIRKWATEVSSVEISHIVHGLTCYSNCFAFGINNEIEMTASHHGATRYPTAQERNSTGLTLRSKLQVEYCLVDLSPETKRATLVLDHERIIRQWEKNTASKDDSSVSPVCVMTDLRSWNLQRN